MAGSGRRPAAVRLRLAAALALAGLLAGCAEIGEVFGTGGDTTATQGDGATVRMIERDEEAPDVFQVADQGLWDGRPSLGGVWVAHSAVREPERVIIRNEQSGAFVIGALFRRERENPGPPLQVSSDAAAALGMIAGQPARLEVTALRRQQVPEVVPGTGAPGTSAAAEGETIEAETLGPVAAAAAALDRIEAAGPATAPVRERAPSGLARPFVQVGIFSIEANANRTGDVLRREGIVPTVTEQELRGRKYWRVLVGPAGSRAEADALLATVKGAGYTDAYFVSN